MMTDFQGNTFEFMGEEGNFYNIISERNHQVGSLPCIDVLMLANALSRSVEWLWSSRCGAFP